MENIELEQGEYEAAVERARVCVENTPHATAVRYDKRLRMVMVTLSSGLAVGFRPSDVQGLENADPADLATIEISPSGFGLYFPAVDADVWLPGLLDGHFGSNHWMAAQMGKKGGKARSPAKTAACRANGSKGGRPRKEAA